MLELNGISKVYGQGASQVEALRGVDLNISPGEFVAVMGTSGCGKTTLLNIIGCLDTATSGIYTLQGKDVSRLSLKDKARVRNKTFGFVFQAFNLLAEYTVLENVTLPLRYSGVPKRRWKEQGLGVLERLGIADLSLATPISFLEGSSSGRHRTCSGKRPGDYHCRRTNGESRHRDRAGDCQRTLRLGGKQKDRDFGNSRRCCCQ